MGNENKNYKKKKKTGLSSFWLFHLSFLYVSIYVCFNKWDVYLFYFHLLISCATFSYPFNNNRRPVLIGWRVSELYLKWQNSIVRLLARPVIDTVIALVSCFTRCLSPLKVMLLLLMFIKALFSWRKSLTIIACIIV